MLHERSHIPDEELAMAADGELAPKRLEEVREHLASCAECRGRMSKFEAAIADFVRIHQTGAPLPPIAGPRALLRARLSQAAADRIPSARPWTWRFLFELPTRNYALAAALGTLLLVCAVGLRTVLTSLESGLAPVEAAAAPQPQMTPGATMPLTKEDVCRGNHALGEPLIPASLKQQVFEEYGIASPQASAYEVDYLITPELGGATNIRNLWPQPYYNTTWHARVKDQLEERLHAMVCDGEIDLATAQHEIASNWIAAYKKYFHTQKPLGGRPAAQKEKNVTAEPDSTDDYLSRRGRRRAVLLAADRQIVDSPLLFHPLDKAY